MSTKKSGLELMRIFSMFFIVVYHIIIHSNFSRGCFLGATTGGSRVLLILLEAIMVVHVNSFALLTGYFQSEKKAKLSKVISMVNATWFYKLLCLAGILIAVHYFSLPNSVGMPFDRKLISILPIDRQDNWYINCYLLIYIFSPFLNILINKLDQKKHKKLIMLLFIIFSLVGTLLLGEVVPSYAEGRSILTFILFYFVGAYLRKYPIEESHIFSKYKENAKKYIFLIVWIILAIVLMTFRVAGHSLYNDGRLFQEVAIKFELLATSFLSPIVVIEAIAYFLFFKNMKFNSKVINYIGGTTFGIYLLHENLYVRENIYNWLNMSQYNNQGIKQVLVILVLGIIIFLVCMLVEIIRKAIYKFFYKRKFALKLRNRIQDFIKSLGLDINY